MQPQGGKGGVRMSVRASISDHTDNVNFTVMKRPQTRTLTLPLLFVSLKTCHPRESEDRFPNPNGPSHPRKRGPFL